MQRCWHKTQLTCRGVERLPTAAKQLQSGAQYKALFALPRTCRKRYMLHKQCVCEHACLHAPVHTRARAHTHTRTHTHTHTVDCGLCVIHFGPGGAGHRDISRHAPNPNTRAPPESVAACQGVSISGFVAAVMLSAMACDQAGIQSITFNGRHESLSLFQFVAQMDT